MTARSLRASAVLVVGFAGVLGCGTKAHSNQPGAAAAPADPPPVTPEVKHENVSGKEMVDALHVAFGEHHARAVHTKGTMLEGTFTPTAEARSLTTCPAFSSGTVPVVARFSLFAGLPDLPDNDDSASPAGFAFKLKQADAFDVEANQHKDFITATSDEFRTFLHAAAAAGKGDKGPMDAFLSTHPHAKEFLATRTYPASYAKATYFGVNAFKFTNAKGQVSYVRYRFVPQAGEEYLTAEQRKAATGTYLGTDLAKRIAEGPITFDWVAQIAEAGDNVADPSTAWPESRRVVKLGTITLTKPPADPDTAQRELLFLPGQKHPGVEPADPMLITRNEAYPISFKQRQ